MSDEAVACAQEIEAAAGLRLRGLMAYASHANREPDIATRAAVAAEVKERIEATRMRLARRGVTISVVSGGSTGMWNVDQGLTELQLGSYVLMDGSYTLAIESPFAPAVFCAATLISRRPDRAVVNAGWKAISGESGLPLVPAGLTPLAFSDEHLTCCVDEGAGLELGDQVLLLPAHLDPTMNLHSRVFVIEERAVVDEWPIDIR